VSARICWISPISGEFFHGSPYGESWELKPLIQTWKQRSQLPEMSEVTALSNDPSLLVIVLFILTANRTNGYLGFVNLAP
jgi:hypothetical protein